MSGLPELFTLDARLMNPYATADLEAEAPAVHGALRAWFDAVMEVDDRALNALIRARGPDAESAARERGEQALQACAAAAEALEPLVSALRQAFAGAPPGALADRASPDPLAARAPGHAGQRVGSGAGGSADRARSPAASR